jgi:hypothetical protein
MAWYNEGFISDEIGSTVLLLGNGLNRATSEPSWEDLINQLIDEVKLNKRVIDRSKPFPLIYEEIFLKGRLLNNASEEEMLKIIAIHSDKIRSGELHVRLSELPIIHLLTTNYDLTIVKSFLERNSDCKNKAPVKETRYSLFRRCAHQEKVVWQIHGSQLNHNTIMLGYEHYSGYLGKMRNYVTSSVTHQETSIESLMKRMNEGDRYIISWIDFFFQKNIIILGLSLDFVEMHLWWLLTYRARKIANGNSKIRGKIIFIQSSISLSGKDKKKVKQQNEMLEAVGVEVKVIDSKNKDWKNFYHKALDEIKL